MPFDRRQLAWYAVVAAGAALSLPYSADLNPLAETIYFALALACIMFVTWHKGLQPGLQAGMLATLLQGFVITPENDSERTTSAAAQFSVFLLVVLALAPIRREKTRVRAVRSTQPATRSGSDAILVIDQAGRYVHANPAMAHLVGYTRPELSTLQPRDLIVAPPKLGEAERSRFARQGYLIGSVELRHKSGSRVRARARITALDLPTGTLYVMTLKG